MERAEIVAGYLDRVGLQAGPPTRELLDELVTRHIGTFAFASIGPRLGDALPLDEASLYDRIVVRRRGGYCFEQNGLFFAVLDELGYSPRIALARVLHEEGSHPPLTHRVSIVRIAGADLLVDVGFGAQGPPAPVPLHASAGAGPSHWIESHWIESHWIESHWIEQGEPGELHLRTRRDGVDVSLYRFELSRYGPSDCELGHFYSHRHPEAFFVNTLVASRILPDGVRTLRDADLRIVGGSGGGRSADTPRGHERRVADADDLRAILDDVFDLAVSADEAARLFAGLAAESERPPDGAPEREEGPA